MCWPRSLPSALVTAQESCVLDRVRCRRHQPGARPLRQLVLRLRIPGVHRRLEASATSKLAFASVGSAMNWSSAQDCGSSRASSASTCRAVIMPWARHIATCRELVRTTFDVANKTGDRLRPQRAAARSSPTFCLRASRWSRSRRKPKSAWSSAEGRHSATSSTAPTSRRRSSGSLRGLTRLFGSFDDERFDEHLIQDAF